MTQLKNLSKENCIAVRRLFDFCEQQSEYMSVIRPSADVLSFDAQLDAIEWAIRQIESDCGNMIFMRVFLSDPANQEQQTVSRLGGRCPLSVIGQAPLEGVKIAAWVWMRRGSRTFFEQDGLYRVECHDHDEFWMASADSDSCGSRKQTGHLLESLAVSLERRGMTLAGNCLRTWFFARDIDNSYAGLVEGRNEVFDRCGLTDETHFISSTGIAGISACKDRLVRMDAVAARGFKSLSFLYGESHLNRTSQYGVRFERGTVVRYSDRSHVFISGTASIDNRGNVVHVGDIARQTDRMLENVQVLLAESGCDFSNVGVMLVYLRDMADFQVVSRIFEERFNDIPHIILHAAVCRPAWLIEMECVAIKANV